jgi:hypothetical protein
MQEKDVKGLSKMEVVGREEREQRKRTEGCAMKGGVRRG